RDSIKVIPATPPSSSTFTASNHLPRKTHVRIQNNQTDTGGETMITELQIYLARLALRMELASTDATSFRHNDVRIVTDNRRSTEPQALQRLRCLPESD